MRAPVAGCLLVVLLAGCGGGGSGTSGGASSPAPASAQPVAGCLDPQEQAASGVSLPLGPGGHVDAVIEGSGTTGIVFSNMNVGDLCQWLPTAVLYSRQGYRVAVYNYSPQAADGDLLAVVAELRRRGATRIALVGASMGGTTSLVAAKRAGAAAVFELSAPAEYGGMDALAAVRALAVPTWFGVGENDTEFLGSARSLYGASGAATKHLEVVPTGAHGTELLGAAVDRMMSDFLHRYAPP